MVLGRELYKIVIIVLHQKTDIFALKSQKMIIKITAVVMFCMREDDFLLLNLVDVNSCEVSQNV